MDIEALGAWGEFLGGISGVIAALGVIATLIYLARQIHQNTKSVQSANLGTYLDSQHYGIESHMQVVDIFDDAVMQRRDLDATETWRMHVHYQQTFMMLEAVFLFRINRTVDREYYESRMRMLGRIFIEFPGYKEWWVEWATSHFDERFIAYVKNTFHVEARPAQTPLPLEDARTA